MNKNKYVYMYICEQDEVVPNIINQLFNNHSKFYIKYLNSLEYFNGNKYIYLNKF